MAEDRGPVKRSEGKKMEASRKQGNNNTIIKRKRLDANIFKEGHIDQAKKYKVSTKSMPSESKDVVLDKTSVQNQSCRMGYEGQSQPGNGETILESVGLSLAEQECDQDRASSSVDVQLHENTHGEMIEDLEPCNNYNDINLRTSTVMKKSEDLPDFQKTMPRYVEFWVPVSLSYVQLEKYCETLSKNSMFLCSSLKNEVLDGLHDVLSTIRKCCDHPYLVDSSLQKFVNDGRPVGDYLSNGIEVSGKLLLLDKMLQEVKRKQLRVLIVIQDIQSMDSKLMSNNLQHFLDDLICEKVGEECYVNIYREFDSPKKRAAVNLFNDKDSGKLVMLIEKGSCQPNIKLFSVDCVILFNSDWRPTHDLKSLQKMSIQSNGDSLKVFRLYSSNSVEEKALILAKEGNSLESNVSNFSHSITHLLLLWGVFSLFSKLDALHSDCSSIKNLSCLCEDKLATEVTNEFSAILSCEDDDMISYSRISKVPGSKDDISEIVVLHGEEDEPTRDNDIPPWAIWSNLLEGRKPMWKLLPGSSERLRRRGELMASPVQCFESNDKGAKMTCKRNSHSGDENFCPKPWVRKGCRSDQAKRRGEMADPGKLLGKSIKPSSCRYHYSSLSQIEETWQRRMRELILKQKEEILLFYRTNSEIKAKLEKEHQLEVDVINQKYGETELKQDSLKNLDLLYEQKLEKHNREMATKREELEEEHLASRLKEKELKDDILISLKKSLSSQQTVDLTKHPINSATMIPILDPDSESKHSHEIKPGTVNLSAPRVNPCSPDRVTEIEIIHVASDEENDAISFREEVSDNADCRVNSPVPLRETEMRGATDSSSDTTVIVQQTMEAVGASIFEAETRGVADSGSPTTMIVQQRLESVAVYTSEAEAREAADLCTTATVMQQQRIEDVPIGDCILKNPAGSSNGEVDMGGAADLCTTATMMKHKSIEEVIDGDSNNETIASSFDGEVDLGGTSGTTAILSVPKCIDEGLHGDSNNEALFEASNEIDMRTGSDSGTTTNVAGQQRIEVVQCENSNVEVPVRSSDGVAEMRVTADLSTSTTLASQQRIDEVRDRSTNIEVPSRESNRDAEVREVDTATPATVAAQESLEEMTMYPSSGLNAGRQILVQSQACALTGNSSPLEQPMGNLPCNMTSHTAGASNRSNCVFRVPASCQDHVSPGNRGSCNQLLMQLIPPTAGWEQPHTPNLASIALPQSANSSFQESSNLRYAGVDPLQDELVRLKNEEAEADKIHKDKATFLQCSRAKEIQEVHRKYDLLLSKAENALTQTKLELRSYYEKVLANKLLADTVKCNFQKQTSSSMPPDLLYSILQLTPEELNLAVHGTLVANVEATATPAQVVHDVSQLMSLDTSRSPYSSTLPDPGNPLAAYLVRSSICPPRPINSASTSMFGFMNQQPAFCPPRSTYSSHQLGYLPGTFQLGNTMQRPGLLFGGTSQNPHLL
ncbi:unnamed protein product [Amaranthus hypochondriacus]